MELSGIRQRQLLPVSRDDIDISKWKSGNEPIIMTSIVDGKVIEHKPYDFTNIFHSTPAPVEQIEQEPEPALSLDNGSNGVEVVTKQTEKLGVQ